MNENRTEGRDRLTDVCLFIGTGSYRAKTTPFPVKISSVLLSPCSICFSAQAREGQCSPCDSFPNTQEPAFPLHTHHTYFLSEPRETGRQQVGLSRPSGFH